MHPLYMHMLCDHHTLGEVSREVFHEPPCPDQPATLARSEVAQSACKDQEFHCGPTLCLLTEDRVRFLWVLSNRRLSAKRCTVINCMYMINEYERLSNCY